MQSGSAEALGCGRDRRLSRVGRCGVIALAIVISACGPSGRSEVTTPTSPTALTPPPNSGLAVATVFGFAHEHIGSEARPLNHVPLQVHARKNGKDWVTIDVVTDAAGRYEVPGLDREYLMVSARPQNAYLSPCSVRLWLWNDEAMNVHLIARASLLSAGTPRSMPPFVRPAGYFSAQVLSGVVTERTAVGVRPVVSASVEHFYGDGHVGSPTGFTLTNPDGSYVLCGYDDDYGQAVRVAKAGYRTATQRIGRSWTMDFELVPE